MLRLSSISNLFSVIVSFYSAIREKMKDVKGMLAVCGQVFLDQFVHHPLLYFPVFYATRVSLRCFCLSIITVKFGCNHNSPPFHYSRKLSCQTNQAWKRASRRIEKT